jgi:hypothetical protein
VRMLDGVGGEVDRAKVVTVDEGSLRPGDVVQLLRKLTELACLLHAIGHDTVLHPST